jgi:hypothetical protein
MDQVRIARSQQQDQLDQRVLSFLMEFLATAGFSPTLREIQAGCGIGSLRTTQDCIGRLEARGAVRREPGRGRSLRVLENTPSAVGLDLATLHLFAVLGEGLYPYFCRAAALAPTRASAEGWLSFVLGQVRQVDAIRQALGRAQRLATVPADALQDVARVWRRVEEHVQGIPDWLGWVAQEEYWTEDLFNGGVPARGTAALPEPAMVLQGNLETGRRTRQFVAEELARLRAMATDSVDFAGRLAEARQRAGEVYRGVEPVRRRIMGAPAGPQEPGVARPMSG